MNFQTDKSLRNDTKKVFHQRRLDMNFKGYDAEQDEVLVALANIDLLEQIEVGNSSSSERNNPDEAAKNQQIEVATPLKGKKSLKRHSTNTTDMDADVPTKKPRIYI